VGRGVFRGLYVASDCVDSWIDEARTRSMREGVEFLVVQDILPSPLAQAADVVLAGATFAEKAGSYVNADGRLQYSVAALPPRVGSLPDLDLLAILLGRPGSGPIRSRDILVELAGAIPAFAVAEGGKVPGFGTPLAEAEPVVAGASSDYNDPWTTHRFLKGDRPGEPSPKGGANA
jgi:predicted molibdopterin-dependent oxidoreductase YjgC